MRNVSQRSHAIAAVLALGVAAPALAQNLMANGDFDRDLGGWELDADLEHDWISKDADGSLLSGSMEVRTESEILFWSGQCIEVTPGVEYLFSARTWLGTDQPEGARSGLRVDTFTDKDCSRDIRPLAGPRADVRSDSWESLWLDFRPREGEESILASVGVASPSRGQRTTVFFDDVALVERAGTCVPGEDRLCPQDGRFEVTVTWRDFEDNDGSGLLAPLSTDESGLFYFFAPSNWELLVKVIDACALNDRYWVFSAATTNVEFELVVTDTRAGETRRYFNALGTKAPANTDTQAFSTCP